MGYEMEEMRMLWNTVQRALGFGLLLFMLSPSTQAEEDVIVQLVPCVIQVESGGDPNAVGSSGEIGLMQISPIVYKEWEQHQMWTYKEPKIIMFNPEWNRTIGTWYLRRLKDHYIPKNKYSVELLLACYNAGPTRMRKNGWDWHKAPKSTLYYIKKVLRCLK